MNKRYTAECECCGHQSTIKVDRLQDGEVLICWIADLYCAKCTSRDLKLHPAKLPPHCGRHPAP